MTTTTARKQTSTASKAPKARKAAKKKTTAKPKRAPRVIKLAEVRPGYTLVHEPAAGLHILAPTLARAGVATACGAHLVDLDGDWIELSERKIRRSALCSDCAGFGAYRK